MAVRSRRGFTLVELLVVIVIISMLVALLVPAVIAARAAARKAQCTNNQAELSKALVQYEMAKTRFPGFINRFGAKANLSWVTMILPYLGREDLWRQWRDTAVGAEPRIPIDQLMCPSDVPPETGALSYAINCGKWPRPTGTPPNPPWQVHGIAFDQSGAIVPIPVVGMSNITDGTQTTIMFGENVQAYVWYSVSVYEVGLLWGDSAATCSLVNMCVDTAGSQATDWTTARPSSFHSGGAVVSYCDGHQAFLRDDTDYPTFKKLMAPDDYKNIPSL